MKMKATAVVAVCTALAMSLSPQIASASKQSARANAIGAAQGLQRYGYNFRREYTLGVLAQGARDVVATRLYAGNDYALIASGCTDAKDVDIEVYDENWNLIARDQDSDRVAVVRVRPRWTGTFYMVVKMYRASGGGAAHWLVVTGYK